MGSFLPIPRQCYGAELAQWLANDPSEIYLTLMTRTTMVLEDLFDGETYDADADVRAVLCSIREISPALERAGREVFWDFDEEYGAPPESELYQLATLSVPNLTSDEIRVFDPLTVCPTIGVAAAVCGHPAADDDLIVDLVHRFHVTRCAKNQRALSHLGMLHTLAGFSVTAKAAVKLICSGAMFAEAGMAYGTYRGLVDRLSAGGTAALDALTVLIDDHVGILRESQLIEYAEVAARL